MRRLVDVAAAPADRRLFEPGRSGGQAVFFWVALMCAGVKVGRHHGGQF